MRVEIICLTFSNATRPNILKRGQGPFERHTLMNDGITC